MLIKPTSGTTVLLWYLIMFTLPPECKPAWYWHSQAQLNPAVWTWSNHAKYALAMAPSSLGKNKLACYQLSLALCTGASLVLFLTSACDWWAYNVCTWIKRQLINLFVWHSSMGKECSEVRTKRKVNAILDSDMGMHVFKGSFKKIKVPAWYNFQCSIV